MRNKLLSLLVLGLVSAPFAAQSAVIPVSGGFEVSYDLNLAGTLNNNPVTNIVILETDGIDLSVSFGFSAAAVGPTTLSHVIDFLPNSALVIGLDLGTPGLGDGKTHLVMLQEPGFAAAHFGQLFSVTFPAVGDTPRVRHDELVNALLDAEAGDANAKTVLTNFFLTGAGSFAAFDPAGSFRVVEYSIGTPIDVPAPAPLALLGLGLLGFAATRRR